MIVMKENFREEIEDGVYLDVPEELHNAYPGKKEIVNLYRDWLQRMSGLSFSEIDSRKEMVNEIANGNGQLVVNRMNDVVFIKKLLENYKVAEANAMWENILLDER